MASLGCGGSCSVASAFLGLMCCGEHLPKAGGHLPKDRYDVDPGSSAPFKPRTRLRGHALPAGRGCPHQRLHLLSRAPTSGIVVVAAIRAKLARNEERYPVDKARGSNAKYNEQ